MPLKHLPIQRKLVGLISLTTITVLIGSFLVLFFYESSSSEKEATLSLKTMADIIAANSSAAIIYDDPKLAQEILSGLRAEPDITEAALFDKQGKLYAVYPAGTPPSNFPAQPLQEGARISFSELAMFQPIVQDSKRVGTVFLRSDLQGVHRRLRVYSVVLIWILGGSAVLAYFFSNFLQRQISQPILNLAEAARAVSERKDYGVRAEKTSGDELGFVTEAFNSMLEQIQLNHAVLGESEQRFRAVADSAPVLIWIVDAYMLATWFNKNWLDFVGRTMPSEVGTGWEENVHPEDREHFLRVRADAFELKEYFRIEFRLRRHDGVYRWLLNQGAPRYQGDEFVGFIGSCFDITDSKEAEASLRLSELQMRMVTDKASVFLCQIDRRHRFSFANKAYANRYGLEPASVVGKHVSEVIGAGAYGKVREKMDAALAGERQEYEMELVYPNLGARWIHAVYEPERNDEGVVTGIVTAISDLTERQQSAKQLERARDEAINASRAKDDFLAALSHELRTPLNPVLLLATDAATNSDLPDDVRNDFETIRKNVELEARLIDDLLDLTRVTNGKMVLEHKLVDIHEVIRDALANIAAELASRKIELISRLEADRFVVKGDAVRLQQVFWNVFKNAAKFTPEKGRIEISTEDSRDQSSIVVRIADTGIGLSSTELKTIFEAFTQGDHARGGGSHRFGGLGLGLAISRKLVELHSGQISAASKGRDQGSTFTIELPIPMAAQAPGSASDLPADSSGAQLGMAPDTLSAVRSILLIEDHAPTRVALERLLQRRHYRVWAGGSVAEALVIAARERLDFVISDIGLPDGTGYELMEQLAERFQLKGIALTGYGMDRDIERSRQTGFVVHLTKPVSIQALDSAIAELSATVLRAESNV